MSEEEDSDEGEETESGEEEDEGDEDDGGKSMGMAYEKTTVNSVRQVAKTWEEKLRRSEEESLEKQLDPGMRERPAAETLRQMLAQRFGCCTRGWRDILDKRGLHRVGRADFFVSLRELGFHGDAKAAWCELTGATVRDMAHPQARQVTLADVDDEAAQLLSEFYRTYNEEIGKLPGLLRKSDGKRVGEEEFMNRCKVLGSPHFDRPAMNLKAVFKNLHSHNAITEADIAWLTDYCTREKPERPGPTPPSDGAKETREKAARARALQVFRELIQHKFGSIVAGWRKVLDPEAKGELTTEDFKLAAQRLHFKGSVADVWDAVVFDKGRSKNRFPLEDEEEQYYEEGEDEYCLHLGDLEPAVVECITSWQRQCVERYGNMVKAFEDMESEKKPLVSKEEFLRFCSEIRFNHNKHLLWEALDERDVGAILLSDLDGKSAAKAFAEEDIKIASKMHAKMVQVHKGRITLRQRAAKQCAAVKRPPEEKKSSLQLLMKQLESRFDSPVRAWASSIDLQNKGKVKTEEFLVGCSAAGFRGSQTKLIKELKLEKGASVRIKNLAPETLEECKAFKLTAQGKIGTIVKAIEASGPAEKKKTGLQVKLAKFEKICKRIGYDGNVEKVFTHFDLGAEGSLNTKTLKGFDASGKEDKVVSNLLKKHHENKQKKHQQSIAEKAVPPVAQLKLKQDSLLIAGREKREKKTQGEARKKEMFRFLEKSVGSVGRAWRLAFDPQNRGEVEESDFIAGLQRSGYLDTSAPQEEIEKARELFDLLADEETGAITLEILDKRTTQALYMFRCRLAGRYGGVKQAFMEFDPGGLGVISSEQFRHMCHEARMTDNVRRLLEYLDPEDQDQINLDLIDEEAARQAKEESKEIAEARETKKDIDERKGRSHMKAPPPDVGVACGVEARREERLKEAGQKLLAEFKRRLLRKHGTLVRAWQRVMKQPEKNSINFTHFKGIFEGLGIEGDPKAAWNAIERKGNSLTLNEFDPGVDADFRELRARMTERYGSLEKAFDEVDQDGSYELDMQAFFNLTYEVQFRRNERRLFAYLDSERLQRISLASIDSKAVEAVKVHREREAEARALRDGVTPPDNGSESSTPSSSGRKAKKDKNSPMAAIPDAGPPQVARAFREQLQRRFGSMIRAWRMIDFDGKVALTKREFARAVQCTGYAGNASSLWSALGGGSEESSLISLRELDPEVFRLLVSFRNRCEDRDGLEKAFTEANESSENRLSRQEFQALCRKVGFRKGSWERLFQQLDVRSVGSVTWEEVRFLEEQWDWEEEPPEPKRSPAGNGRTLPAAPGSPERTSGLGHMCMSMRPRIIGGMRKSNSLPAISAPLRDNWNDRHHVLDRKDNKDMQLMHMVTCVLTKDRERIKRKVATKMAEVSTAQWLQENMPMVEDDEEDDDEDEDYDF